MTLHQVLLNDLDRTAYCLGWETEQAATYGTRSARVEFTLDVSPAVFDAVELKGDYAGTLYTVFEGVVTKVAQALSGKSYVSDCLDYTYFLFFRLIFAKSYVNKKAHEIIADLLTTYMSDVTTVNVATFTKPYDKTFDKVTVFEAIRYLAETEDADFWVRWDKDLYFKPRSAASQASIGLSQGTNVLEALREQADDRLVNWLRFIGGVGTKPSDKDAWTENSGWDQSGGLSLTYDDAVKAVGSYSVKGTHRHPSNPQLFWYPSAKDLALTIGSVWTKLYLRLRATYTSWNTLQLELCRDAARYTYRALTLAAADSWEQKTYDIGPGSAGWTLAGGFSWAVDPVNYIQLRHIADLQTFYTLGGASNGQTNTARFGERITLGPCIITRISCYLTKYGNPTGTLYVRIRRVSDDAILKEWGSIDASTISSSGAWYNFDSEYEFTAATEVRVLHEFPGDGTNAIRGGYGTGDPVPGPYMTQYFTATGYQDITGNDTSLQIKGGGSPNRNVWVDELYLYSPQIELDKQDAASQSTYRRRDALKSDNTVSDSAWAENWAQNQVALHKNPYSRLKVIAPFLPGQVEAGQNIQVTIGDFGINAENYRVLACRHRVPDAVTELDLCPVLPLSLEEALAKVRRELSDVIRRTA